MSWLSSLVGVFLIGHSLFGPTNPQMLSQVLAAQNVRVDAQIINGAPLSYNWENGAKAEGLNARRALPAGGYNVAILTEAIPLANQLAFNDSAGYARRYYDLAVTSHPQARVYLQETWHDLRSGSGIDIEHDDQDAIPWRDRIETDLGQWQSIVDAVNAQRPKGAEPMRLIPAGQAIARLTDEIAAGTVPGLNRIEQIFHDTIHPNDLGFYFLTMVQYAAITGESPVGLPRRPKDKWGKPYDAPTPALAQRLQQIASEAVAAFNTTAPAPPAAVTVAQVDNTPAPPTQGTIPPKSTATISASSDFQPSAIPDGPVPMAIGLAGVNDWSVQQPFLDVFKTTRPWFGHLPGQWGGVNYEELKEAGYLDAQGWPVAIPPELSSIATLILTDLPEEAASTAGRYVLRYDGKGVIEVTGRARNPRYGKNQIEFDFTPGPGPVEIRIQRTHLKGDYIRNITVVKQDKVTAYDAGAMFNPLWLDRLQGFEVLRFMDWMETNNSRQAIWSDRPRPDDFTYAMHGVPAEVMVELLNRTGADGWFNMPHLADDEYMRRFAEVVRDQLWIEQKAYVELSNEVWNWQFQQAQWAEDQARARWNKNDLWVEYYAARAVEMAEIWRQAFGDQAKDRLIRVISTQTGWIGLEELILAAPDWVAEQPNRPHPATFFDAYAVTGYFGGTLGWEERGPMVHDWLAQSRATATAQADKTGLSGPEHETYVETHRYDLATQLAQAELRDGAVSGQKDDTLQNNLQEILPHHAAVAEKYGLSLIMYEGGSHVVGVGPTVDDPELEAFFTHFNYTPEMGALYREMIAGWAALGGQLFNAYADIYRPNKWGSWGHLRYLSDDNPRWDAMAAFR